MVLDGLMLKTSNDPNKSKKINTLSRFLFERVVIGEFIPTELIEHAPN
jgi:hypothetical protein